MKDPEKLARHAEMKLRECRLCLFFDMDTKACSIGMKNCPLTAPAWQDPDQENTEPIPFFPCSRCPYGQGERPCVSFCMKKLLLEWRRKRDPVRKEGADDA